MGSIVDDVKSIGLLAGVVTVGYLFRCQIRDVLCGLHPTFCTIPACATTDDESNPVGEGDNPAIVDPTPDTGLDPVPVTGDPSLCNNPDQFGRCLPWDCKSGSFFDWMTATCYNPVSQPVVDNPPSNDYGPPVDDSLLYQCPAGYYRSVGGECLPERDGSSCDGWMDSMGGCHPGYDLD